MKSNAVATHLMIEVQQTGWDKWEPVKAQVHPALSDSANIMIEIHQTGWDTWASCTVELKKK